MSEQITLIRTGKRGKAKGLRDFAYCELKTLNEKFSDPSTKIPVQRKFLEFLGLSGVTMDKATFEDISNPKEPEAKIDIKVEELE